MNLNLPATLLETYRFMWESRRDLWAYALLPVVLVALVKTLVLWGIAGAEAFFDPQPLPLFDPNDPGIVAAFRRVIAVTLISMIASLLAYALFAVAWHRRFLVGNEGQTVGAAMRWGRRQWRFIGRFVGLMVIVAVFGSLVSIPVAVVSTTAPILGVLAFFTVFVIVGLVYGRLLLVLPAAAMDDPIGFRDSAELTKGRSWLMFGIGILPPIPVLLAMAIVLNPLTDALAGLIGPSVSLLLVIFLLEQAFTFAGVAAGVTALSIAYRELAGSPGAPGAPTTV